MASALSFTWLGHSTFLFRSPGGKRILIEPFVASNPSCPESAKKLGELDLILITHGHSDHAADAASIAVSIEPTPPTERAALYARVAGLSERESELLTLLVAGADTRELARRLFVSEHTVQDHLKSVFAKTGVNNRRVLVARATGLT